MSKSSHRKFGIADAIALIAATAVASAATRHGWPRYFDNFRPGGFAYQQTFPDFMYMVRHLFYSASYFTAAWTLACLQRITFGMHTGRHVETNRGYPGW
jgi:hypothetical protein